MPVEDPKNKPNDPAQSGDKPPVPAKESAPAEQEFSVKEAADLIPRDAEGRLWDIVAIQEGVSLNGTFDYPGDTLVRDAHVFEGVPIAVSREAYDHHDAVGVCRKVAGEEIEGGKKAIVVHEATIDDPDMRARMLAKLREGDPYQFSIDAQVRAVASKDASGRVRHRVTAIVRPTELTIVRRGAAGGRVRRLVASAKGEGQMPANATENSTPKPAATVADVDKAASIAAATAEADKRAKESEASANKLAETENRLAAAIKKAEDAEKATLQRVAESEFKIVITEKLASSKLPTEARERIRESFVPKSGLVRISAAEDIDAAIKSEQTYIARITASAGAGRITGCGAANVEIVADVRDKYQAAMDGFFAGKDCGLRAKESDKVPRFKSFLGAIELIENGGRRMDPQDALRACYGFQPESIRSKESYQRARESIGVSDFANILGDSITRQLLANYNFDPRVAAVLKLVSRRVPVSDFRTQHRMRMGGYGLLPAVAERGTYNPLSSPGDEEATYAISKRGGLEDITIEAVANDDVGAIQRIPSKLAQSAAETLYQTFFDMFQAPTALGAVIYDTKTLWHADHGNASTSAFSKTTMNAARKAMRQQTAAKDTTKRLGSTNLPRFWIGPPDLEEAANIMFRSQVKVTAPEAATTNENSTVTPNLHFGIEPIVVDYWTDAADCMLVADPSKIDTIELGFYRGQEEPELFVQDLPNVGSSFNADKITWKIRHIYGMTPLDYRPFYGFSRAI